MKDRLNKIKEISRNGFKYPENIKEEDINFIEECLIDSDTSLVARSYWAIGQIGIKRPDFVEHLIEMAFTNIKHANAEIRENALFAIGRTGRSKINLVNKRISDVIQLYKDEIPKVRLSMVWACENIANTDADLFAEYIPIFEILLDDKDEQYVRGEAPEIFRVIGKYRPELVEGSLIKLKEKLNDSCRVTRIHSAGAIKIIEKNLKLNSRNKFSVC
jgi:hypothetical protein